jgi:hypothetical protein
MALIVLRGFQSDEGCTPDRDFPSADLAKRVRAVEIDEWIRY